MFSAQILGMAVEVKIENQNPAMVAIPYKYDNQMYMQDPSERYAFES